MSTTGPFDTGKELWLERLGNLRNVVRQEVVSRQLGDHLPRRGARVLDVGAGQGTQALRLAHLGHDVTALEPDRAMRDVLTAAVDRETFPSGGRVRVVDGRLGELPAAVTGTAYGVVLCHGVLMYLPESDTAVAELAARVAPGGMLSVLTRNAASMAWRPAARGQWNAALAMLDELDVALAEGRDATYTNEIGSSARADRRDHLVAICQEAGLDLEAWYGVRIATDSVPADTPVPGDREELAAVFDLEERLGRTDPYRSMGSLMHLVARRAHAQAPAR